MLRSAYHDSLTTKPWRMIFFKSIIFTIAHGAMEFSHEGEYDVFGLENTMSKCNDIY